MPTIHSGRCQATLIAATGSGQGKTLFTAALARLLVNAGQKVQVFKVGPDYLDPMILEAASGRPVWNLDWWMMGEKACLTAVHRAAAEVDVILVEGLMGLYDSDPSNAWLAKRLGMSVTLVMDMSKFAQTAAAVVHGMQQYDRYLVFSSVVGNRLGSEHHRMLVAEAMPESIPYAGSIRRDDRMMLPERHLGLVQAKELHDLSERLDNAAICLQECALDLSIPEFVAPAIDSDRSLDNSLSGKIIAVARDAAFSFIYPANIALLESLGAEIRYFSPLANEMVPESNSLWLPGGYPELYLSELAESKAAMRSIQAYIESDKPGLAECGGMMVLGNSITPVDGLKITMAEAMAADFVMTNRFQSVGHQMLDVEGQEVRGHSFHHSRMETQAVPLMRWNKRDGSQGEGVYQVGGVLASYCHCYFGSCPEWISAVF